MPCAGNERLKNDGQVEETVGKVEAAIGRTTRKASDAIARAGRAVKKA